MGTLVKEGSEVVADLAQRGQEYIAALGGAGGKGNRFFLANDNRAPVTCTPGEPGQERVLHLELKTDGGPRWDGGSLVAGRAAGLGDSHSCSAHWSLSQPCLSDCSTKGLPGVTGCSHCLPGRLPQCWEVLAPRGHFKCKTCSGFLPVHHLEPAHGDCSLQRSLTGSR